jgi:CubicO group peptidase (beta-lactamase class C family)
VNAPSDDKSVVSAKSANINGRDSRRKFSAGRRWARWSVLAIAAIVVLALIVFRPDRAARVAVGLSAHTLCSAVFVSGLDPDVTVDEHIRTVLGRAASHIRYSIDTGAKTVEASFGGFFRTTAQFTQGYGCRLRYPDNEPLSPISAGVVESTAMDEIRASSSTPNPDVEAAIDRVFTETAGAPRKFVQAVLVMHDGHLIAERYAKGVSAGTPLLGYSVAKSFTNALLGILVRDGRLSVGQRVGAEEWAAPNDPRGALTIEDLLRMRSGLDVAETGSGFDPVSRMEFTQSDMAAFAASHPLKEPPGARFEYTSGNTLILDRLIGRTIGGGAAGLRLFAERELFTPLGMHNVTLESDGRGVFIGSTFVYATARDFAKFGELYRNDGLAPDGRRILPPGWAAWSRKSTLGASYGAGFWTNDGSDLFATLRIKNGFPADGYFASGFLGQRIYIVPSAKLVIVRCGLSAPPDFGIEDDLVLIAASVRALATQ